MKKEFLFEKARSNNGYTIIELIITLCISVLVIGVTMSFSLSFFDSVRISALDTEAENICVLLQKQITAAMSDGYSIFIENDVTPAIFKIDENDLVHSKFAAEQHGTNDIICIKSDILKNQKICDSAYIDIPVSDNFFIVEIDIVRKQVCAVFCSDSDKLYELYDSYIEGIEVIGISDRNISSRRAADIKIGYFSMSGLFENKTDVVFLTPQIEIFNRDDICLTVKTALPKNINIDVENVCNLLTLHLIFTGRDSGKELIFDTVQGAFQKCDGYAEYTIQITEGKDEENENLFILKDINETIIAQTDEFNTGEDIEVSAKLSYGGTDTVSIQKPNISTYFNALYSHVAVDKNGIKTAYITCGRHLQNVGRSAEITKYVICNDIDWNIKYCYRFQGGTLRTDDNGNIEPFYPLNGKNISLFDGRGNKIENIYIDSDKDCVGLFSEIGSTDRAVTIIKKCLLIDINITFNRNSPQNSNSRIYVGALAGKVYNSEITFCSSYRTSTEKSSAIRFGDTCGGLIGKLSDSSVQSSFSSISVIESSDNTDAVCGGLIGEVVNSSIDECYAYADMIQSCCYAGGFIGSADEASMIARCYSVSGISSPFSAGFIFAGSSNVNSCYAVLRFNENSKKTNTYYGFAPSGTNIDADETLRDFSCCYLLDGADGIDVSIGVGESITYKKLSGIISANGTKWVYTEKELSHLYEIDTNTEGKSEAYPFPIIKSIGEYRGWWPSSSNIDEKPNQSGFISFAYYEIYQNGDVGISFTDADGNKIDTLKYSTTDLFAVQDGYAAIANCDVGTVKADLYNISADIKNEEELFSFIASENMSGAVTELTLNYSYETNISENKYILYPLSYKTLMSDTENFYKCIVLNTSNAENTFLFASEFADIIVSVDKISDGALYPLPEKVYIRSPRHLVALGRNSLKNDLCLSECISYIQTIDIDFSVYTTQYDDCQASTEIELIQSPIGSAEKPFCASFNGNNFKIKNLLIESPEENYVGLFGAVRCSSSESAVGECGYISNIRLVDPTITGQNYVGALVGAAILHGETEKPLFLNNCGVYLSSGKVEAAIKGNSFIGGLVGATGRESFDFSEFDFTEYSFDLCDGDHSLIIANCFSAIDVYGHDNSEYIGGFIGLSSSNIYYSYSSGSVFGDCYVGGFAGAHIGTTDNGKIYYCYSSSNVNADLYVGSFVGRCGANFSTISYSYSVGAVESNDTVTAFFYGNIDEAFGSDIFDCIFLVNDSARDKLDDIIFGERDYEYFYGIRDEAYLPNSESDSFYYFVLPNVNIKSYPYREQLKNKSYPFAMIGEIRPYGFWSADEPVKPEISAVSLPHYGDWPS